jgi:hypothetical protein
MPNLCRSLNEILYIAYLRLYTLKKANEMFVRTFISEIKPQLSEGQVTKVLIAASHMTEDKDNGIKGSPLFK